MCMSNVIMCCYVFKELNWYENFSFCPINSIHSLCVLSLNYSHISLPYICNQFFPGISSIANDVKNMLDKMPQYSKTLEVQFEKIFEILPDGLQDLCTAYEELLSANMVQVSLKHPWFFLIVKQFFVPKSMGCSVAISCEAGHWFEAYLGM